MSGEVGRHLEFCALTGNEARGLELLAENRNLFDEVDSPLELLDFLNASRSSSGASNSSATANCPPPVSRAAPGR